MKNPRRADTEILPIRCGVNAQGLLSRSRGRLFSDRYAGILRLVDYEARIGHVGVLRDILLDWASKEGDPELPVASAMRLLDKGDWDGLAELFAANGISSEALDNLRKLSELDGGSETLDSVERY